MYTFWQIITLAWLRYRLWQARRAVDRAHTRVGMRIAVDNMTAIHRQIKSIEQLQERS